MVGAVKSLFGGDNASKRQERMLRKQEADLAATEAGQRRLREGGRGLLAFVDEEIGGLLGGMAGGTTAGGGGSKFFRRLGGLS